VGALVTGYTKSVGEIVTLTFSDAGLVRTTRSGAVRIDDPGLIASGALGLESPNHSDEAPAALGLVMKNFSCPRMLIVTGPTSVTRSTNLAGLVTVDIVTGPTDPSSFWKYTTIPNPAASASVILKFTRVGNIASGGCTGSTGTGASVVGAPVRPKIFLKVSGGEVATGTVVG
jgi:hypothetical protein